jgi:hypothetical protein
MPGRRAFLRRRHVFAAAVTRDRDRVIPARPTRVRVVSPAEGSAGLATCSRRSGTGSQATRRGRSRAAGHELRCLPVACGRGCWRRGRSGQRRAVSAVDPDDRSDERHPERPVGPLACPVPVSTRRRRDLISEPRADTAGLVQQAGTDQERPAATAAVTEADGDATADNVSSPKPRTRGGYSEDTPIRA